MAEPGPWTVSPGGLVIYDVEGSVVAEVSPANARLIASAPDLLAALPNPEQQGELAEDAKYLARWLKQLGASEEAIDVARRLHGELLRQTIEARTALAKAKGES
jgi:hypothetical protein